MSFKIGVDVGGTFTDLFLWKSSGSVGGAKVLSTPEDPSVGVLEGIGRLAESEGLDVAGFLSQTDLIVHGTTVTTNAVLTRTGARTGLLTTEGVRDALEMRRGIREKQYDNRYRNVVPLIPRRRRLPVRGRLDYQGTELTPLRIEDVKEGCERFLRDGVEAVAICFMHSYASNDHEREAAALVRSMMPDAFVSVSSELLPTIRFYDRVSTTALNAYVGPVLSGYMESLTGKLAAAGFESVLLIMQSNGGVAKPEVTRARPATTLLSGPAGGPRAAAAYAAVHDAADLVLMDMGGTSFDASLVRSGNAELRKEGEIDRLRIALPMLSITTIGAGGGSIGWLDEGGLLRMGPASAGAMPGPACYGRGGSRPTCTDADLLLGYLDPVFFAGGNLPLDPEASRAAVEREIAVPLGLDVEAAAAGMYRVINTNMANGVREITVKHGLDPREFLLVVAGGAGPLHACVIALELGMTTVLLPATASTLCATGMLLCDLQHDYVKSLVGSLDRLDPAEIQGAIDTLKAKGEEELKSEGAQEIVHETSFDLRYQKQYHEVTVAVLQDAVEQATAAFHAEHNRLYGYDLEAEGTPLELINIRVRSLGRSERPELPKIEGGSKDLSKSLKGHRKAFIPDLEGGLFEEVPVYDGHLLRAGNRVEGPALVERIDTTALITASFFAVMDDLGSIYVTRKEAK